MKVPIGRRYEHFNDRVGRAGFIKDVFKKEIEESESVLDVGCDYNNLKAIIGEKVVGVDLYGEPDVRIDFDKNLLSVFKDGSFDTVVCTEVLEHLEFFHEMMDELLRVSDKYVVISLPNCLNTFTKLNIFSKNRLGKFYGLPFEKPKDRHRWVFGYQEVIDFMENYCEKRGYKINTLFLHFNFSSLLKGRLVRSFSRLTNSKNLATSVWILIEKP